MKNFFINLTLILTVTFGIAAISHAYCVKNKTDKQIIAYQNSGYLKKYNTLVAYTLNPNDKGCCSWREGKCNISRKKDTLLDFTVVYTIKKDNVLTPIIICKYFKIKADGVLSVVGKNGKYRCLANEN